MKEIKLSSGKYLLVEVPEYADGFQEMNYPGNVLCFWDDAGSAELTLPSGNWQIIGRADKLSEDDWKGIAEPLFSKEEINEGRYHYELDLKPMPYKNYTWNTNDDDGSEFSSLDTAIKSGYSLIFKQGYYIPTTLILKQI